MPFEFDCLVPLLPLADVLYAFRESNISGKVIVFILFAGSIGAWSIMITKGVELKKARQTSELFLREFRREENPTAVFLRRRRFPESPLYRVYEAGCKGLGMEVDDGAGGGGSDLFLGRLSPPTGGLNRLQIDAVQNLTQRNVADQALLLESHMGLLATAVSASPFLGLLGTVWGVMDAFGGMAVKGSATLSAVAPGISGALLTTVIGLLVALPSAVGYNLLTNMIRSLTVQTDNFAQEFESSVRRAFYRE